MKHHIENTDNTPQIWIIYQMPQKSDLQSNKLPRWINWVRGRHSFVKLQDFEGSQTIPQLNYGIVLVLEKRYQEAEKELRKAISRDRMSAQAHYYLGRTLANLRYFADAQKELLRAIDLGGDEVKEAHRYLGAVYNAQGNSRAAIAELEMYLRLSPQVKDAPEIRKIIAGLESEIRPTTEKQPR